MSDFIPALTVCQPYASLLLLPDDEPEMKRTENRVWATHYRGPLVIHAGQSRKWLETYEERLPPNMTFGELLGVVDVVECFTASQIRSGNVPEEYGWLRTHKHIEGPNCLVCVNPRRLAKPIPYRGAQKLWRVPRELVADLLG